MMFVIGELLVYMFALKNVVHVIYTFIGSTQLTSFILLINITI